ncbi:DUF1761 domain-containing protein [bacterium]|nr:DUF1761 domain-containing protein [bacterium]
MTSIILLAILGAVLSAVVGTIWYSMGTPMGKIHMRYLGFDRLTDDEKKQKMEEAKPMMAKMYGGQMLLSLLTSFATVFIITMSMRNGLTFGMALGFIVMNWLCFMVPIIGSGLIWGNCDRAIVWKKFFSDIGANLVTLLVIAFLAKLFV